MSSVEPFNKVRLSARFVTPIGDHTRTTRRFVGTINVAEGSTDLTAVVVGALVGIAREENIDGARTLKVTASVVRPRKRKNA